MHTFFHGWRRKAGVVALVMACAVTSLLLRNRHALEEVGFPLNSRQHGLWAFDDRVCWFSWKRTDGLPPLWGYDRNEVADDATSDDVEEALQMYQRAEDFRYCTFYFTPLPIPLTLLSAYLILWKPRIVRATDSAANK